MSKKRALFMMVIFFIFLLAIITGLYLYKPVSWTQIATVDGMVSYARSFGIMMPAFIFLITAIQAIIPGVPFAILCSASGLLFGVVKGILIIWAATLSGAVILFYIARKLGYGWAEQMIEKYNFRSLNNLKGFEGFVTILVLRLLPYFPAPVINISAGISNVRFSAFFLASALGKLPFIIVYTALGYSILKKGNYLLGSILMILVILIPYLYVRVKKRNKLDEEAEE